MNASTEQVAPWEIDLASLARIGWTAAAAAEWAYRGLTPAQVDVFEGIWHFCGERRSLWRDDSRRAYADVSSYLRGRPGHPTGLHVVSVILGSEWQIEFSVASAPNEPLPGSNVRPLRWRIHLGQLAGSRFLEFLIEQQLGSRLLRVRANPRNKKRSEDPHADWRWFPWHMKMAGRARENRQRLQCHDASEPGPIVVINGGWKAADLAESVMVQLIDWHYRISGIAALGEPNCPAPGADAVSWWVGWVQTAARDSEDVGFAEAVAVAKRSVRPAHPAGHRKYWRDSLRRRGDGPVDQACTISGISRSAAYQRLKQHGRQASEFDSTNDLVEFLRNTEPTRRLPQKRRELIDLLSAAGMKPETARKFEQRIRPLPENEQHARVTRKLNDLRNQTGC